jgi:2-dehydro-3-deoxyglucarate aldolase
MNKYNSLKKLRLKLRNNKPSIGSWMQIPSSSIAEILGNQNYDWVAVDLEHGSFSVESLPDIFRALELTNTLPLARLAECSKENCKKALDAGAAGVIAPMIKNQEELKDIIKYSCWPPSGKRGVGFSRANLFGKNFDKYIKEANSPLIIAMIENVESIKNLKEILNVRGLDGILIGPYDLSASLGVTGDFKNKKFKEHIDLIIKECKKKSIPFGFHQVSPSKKELKNLIKRGCTFIPYSIDSVFLTEFSQNPLTVL